MDFVRIAVKEPTKEGKPVEVRPDFVVGRSKDLMVRGKAFYAIWDEERGLWSTDEYDVQRLVDQKIDNYVDKMKADGIACIAKHLSSFGTNGWAQFQKFTKNVSDNSKDLDSKLTFSNTEVKKSDYASRRLSYALSEGECKAYEELVSVLYSPEERQKIEWAIGAVISGDSKKIEKFLVFYGPPGTGKSTVIKIIQMLFSGYYAVFDAKAMVSNHNNTFGLEAFKSNPLVAIQHDGDLSKVEDGSTLHSVVSHDEMRINEKFKTTYESKINAFLFMGTNKPVKIPDGKSGIIRRLIDVNPTGNKHEVNRYHYLMQQVEFELGAIANHCLEVYRSLGKSYYNDYEPVRMMLKTDVFYNFVEAHFDIFKGQDGITLKQAYALWQAYKAETELEYKLPQYKFREELRNYFEDFHDRMMVDGVQMRSYFSGFTGKQFKAPVVPPTTPPSFSLVVDKTESVFDQTFSSQPAQYANVKGSPLKYWTDEERMIDGEMQKPQPSQVVDTTLEDVDTSKLHFVKVPENHIVIDFDLKGKDGKKSLERNLEAASVWPPTYAEVSKSGSGIHLHYTYTGGDPAELSPNYSEGVEIKVYTGNSSLRRMLTYCNDVPVSDISSGLPFKEKKVLQDSVLKSEKGLRDLIARNLRKEIHPGTKPSIDFIQKILDDAYESGMAYDVTDMRPAIMAFANNSTNQALTCLKVVKKMKFKSEEGVEEKEPEPQDERLVIFDLEVYPNLFVVCWKYQGSDTVVKMINPTPQEVEGLFHFKLVGFNNRDYDNHILWARYMGYDNAALFKLSQKIIVEKDRNAKFGAAFGLSYADIYEFSSVKKRLKKWMIDLGINHMEMDIPWDQPVPDELIPKVVEYCENDVRGTEAVLEDRRLDLLARQILADLSGLSVNDTNRKHSAKIIFGNDRNPQKKFIYTDLSEEFPGYVYDYGKSSYRDEEPGEGGYVYAEPGMYSNVAVLDVESMHPSSIEALDLFGPYTEKFSDLKKARLALKHGRPEEVKKYLPWDYSGEEDAEALSQALKLVINSVYGDTAASFDNPFRDVRNKDNIVAKRGALYMIDLKKAVQDKGFRVVHIKTDSIKIPDATQEIIEFVKEHGKKYGYDFEHEATYDRFCLVNDAVYIAKYEWAAKEKKVGTWDATGAQFQHPWVFKELFSGERITFEDLCETKQVMQGVMYLDHEDCEELQHVGRTGSFIPVTKESGGGLLVRVKDDKSYAVTGTKNHYWAEAEMVRKLNHIDAPFFDVGQVHGKPNDGYVIDFDYYKKLSSAAIKAIEEFGDYLEFVDWKRPPY